MKKEDKNVFFSIIVPLYNVEKYLNRCIDSVVNQDFGDYELILVDDGSTDNSPNICNEYVQKHSNIHYIHQSNQGQGCARNVGVKKACGKYVLFLDSDDFFEEGSLSNLCEYISSKPEFDLFRVNSFVVHDTNITQKRKYNFVVNQDYSSNGQEFLQFALVNGLSNTVWSYVYKREFLVDNNLFFYEGIYHEDEEYLPRVIYTASHVCCHNLFLYDYVIRQNSTMTQKNQTKNASDVLVVCKRLNDFLGQIEQEETRTLLQDRIVELYLYAFLKGKFFHKKERDYIDKNLLKKYAHRKKARIKVKIYCTSKILYYVVFKIRGFLLSIMGK